MDYTLYNNHIFLNILSNLPYTTDICPTYHLQLQQCLMDIRVHTNCWAYLDKEIKGKSGNT